jgi:putative transposase
VGCKTRDKYEAIRSLSGKYPIRLLCTIAGVSRSGYYKWIAGQKQPKDTTLNEIIRFEYSRLGGIYGYRRMKTLLFMKYGLSINHKRVYRLMKQMHLQATIRRKRSYRKFKYERHTVAPNVFNREFHANRPNQKWVTDITYLNVSGKRYFLSVLMDLFNNEVVSYQLSTSLDVGFVIRTVKQAIRERAPEGLLIHSDQGMHYTTHVYSKLLREKGITQSMS